MKPIHAVYKSRRIIKRITRVLLVVIASLETSNEEPKASGNFFGIYMTSILDFLARNI